MKRIIQLAVPETAEFFCDLTRAPLPNRPPLAILIHCGYGTAYDGRTYCLDFSEEAADVVLPLLRLLLLKGAPLESRNIGALLGTEAPGESRVERTELATLLRKLGRLSRLACRSAAGLGKVQRSARSRKKGWEPSGERAQNRPFPSRPIT
jgi:hypothetical protein